MFNCSMTANNGTLKIYQHGSFSFNADCQTFMADLFFDIILYVHLFMYLAFGSTLNASDIVIWVVQHNNFKHNTNEVFYVKYTSCQVSSSRTAFHVLCKTSSSSHPTS